MHGSASVLLLEGAQGFLADQVQALALVVDEGRVGEQALLARSRQLDVDVGDDPPGAGAHHHDAVGEEHRLVDVVGDEHHGVPELAPDLQQVLLHRSEEHTSELQSLMRISYAVFCLKKKKKQKTNHSII